MMTSVWNSSLAGGEKLVALALADWADDDGGSIRPSIATVARKCSLCESQARRTIRKLECAGILSVEAYPSGGRPGATRHLRMHADRLPTAPTDATPRMDATPSVGATPRADATPRVDARDGSPSRAETGGASATRSVIEPSRSLRSSSSDEELPVAAATTTDSRTADSISKSDDRVPPVPNEVIVAAYHELLPTCLRVVEWNDRRKAMLRARWRAKFAAKRFTDAAGGLRYFRGYFEYVAKSPFLTGKAEPGRDRRPFVATLEWLLNPTNFTNVIEGKYHDAAE